MAHSPQSGTQRLESPIVQAVKLALTVVPSKMEGITLITPGLLLLCEDDRFSLKLITPDGLNRAEAVIQTLKSLHVHAQLELLMDRGLMWLQSNARPIGLDPIQQIPELKRIVSMGHQPMLAVEHSIGVLGLTRFYSESSKDISRGLLTESLTLVRPKRISQASRPPQRH